MDGKSDKIESIAIEYKSPRMQTIKTVSLVIMALLLILVARLVGGVASTRQYELATIEADIRRIRELQPLYRAQVEFVTKEEADRHFEQSYAEYSDPESVAQLHLFYQALDLIEPDDDLEALSLAYDKGVIAGYYQSGSETMVVILPDKTPMNALPLGQQTLTYAHEYVHALQDQHYDLDTFYDVTPESDSFDLQLSRSALIEGDANWVIFDYFLELWLENPVAVERAIEAEEDAQDEPADVPAIFPAISHFKYEDGRNFIIELRAKRGWEGVDDAFRDTPPQTSEQIYHPKKYYRGEGAIEIEPPDHSALLEEGWRLAYDNTVGEFYLRQHLRTNLYKSDAAKLSKGWGGDRLRIFTHPANDEMMWVWYQVWDNDRETSQFAAEYPHFLDLRYDWVDSDGLCWSGETTHCFAQINETETRISMAADRSTALALLQLQGYKSPLAE